MKADLVKIIPCFGMKLPLGNLDILKKHKSGTKKRCRIPQENCCNSIALAHAQARVHATLLCPFSISFYHSPFCIYMFSFRQNKSP